MGNEEAECSYQVGISRPRYLCRWWLRSRNIVSVQTPRGLIRGGELYVPLWAWPLELCTR